MGQRHGNAVCGVSRFGGSLEIEQASHHVTDLGLYRRPSTHDRFLDLSWGVFDHWQITVGPGEEDDPAGVTEHDGGPDIGGVEDSLDREHIGAETSCDFSDPVINLLQTLREGIAGPSADDPALDQAAETGCGALDHAVPRDRGAGIDAEDAHSSASAHASANVAASISKFEETLETSSSSSSASISLSRLCASDPETETVLWGSIAISADSMESPRVIRVS